ncbi:hypothetical protein AYI70_g4283 [Smittium culicis]|uniref:DUF4100 domain-containing protein n=1 Tax=Smittium culicis TaxID=133412 RepID=A0A1R1XZR2_9FUNG|nr:hypothetical protein AYI70_g4283 [Smittium culicis]
MLIKSRKLKDLEKIQSRLYNDEGSLLDFDEMVKKIKALNNMQKTMNEILGKDIIQDQTETPSMQNDEVLTMSKMFEKMCIKIDEFMENTTKTISPIEKYDSNKKSIRCVYCDADHRRIECSLFKKDKESGIIRLSADGFIEDKNGIRMTPNWGKGGIRALIQKTQVVSRQIKFEENNDLALEWDSNIEDEEIDQLDFSNLVDSFASKRIRENDKGVENYTSNKKEKLLNPKNLKDVDDVPLKNRTSNTEFINEEFNPAYKMVSKIVNKESEKIVTQKLKNAEVTLSLKELHSISPTIRKQFSEELRVRREPNVISTVFDYTESNENALKSNVETKCNSSNWKDFYLAAGSGKVNGQIMGAGVEFLLDEGSEINIMNIDVFNALNSLNRVKIDENIKWSMRDANQGFSELKGVCKDCLISINGIEVSVPVFVSNNTEPQVILGRPWERKSRAMKDNREDGTLWTP